MQDGVTAGRLNLMAFRRRERRSAWELGEAGQTLPLLLVALALGVLVISALLYAVDARLLTARHLAERMREQYAADAGVEYALNRLMLSPNCGTPGAVTTFALPAPVNGLSPTISVRCVSQPARRRQPGLRRPSAPRICSMCSFSTP